MGNIAHNAATPSVPREPPHARPVRPRLRHPGAARRRGPDPATGARATPIHLRPVFVFETSEQAASVQPGALGPCLQPHQQPHHGGVRGAHGGAGGRRGRGRHRQRPGRAVAGHRHAGRRRRRTSSPAARCTAARTTCCYTLARFGIATTFVRPGDLDAWRAAIRPETRLLLRRDAGQPGHGRAGHPCRRRRRARGRPAAAGGRDLHHALADAPFEHGADLVCHSATKFLCGHGTVVGGVLVDGGRFDWSVAARFPELTSPTPASTAWCSPRSPPSGAFLLRARREGLRDFGACMSPHTAWLMLQGIETLPLRMARHVDNTRKVVAEFLAAAARWWARRLPGTRRPRRATPRRSNCCRAAAARCSASTQWHARQGDAFIEALKLFSHLANVGDCRRWSSTRPAPRTSAWTTPRWRRPASGRGTIRLSIGLEDAGRPDRRPEARAEGRARSPMEARRAEPRGLRLHRRQALRPRPALRGARARRAARPLGLHAAGALLRAPRLHACWRWTCRPHGRSEGPPLASVTAAALGAGAAGRRAACSAPPGSGTAWAP
jgi:O-acetylhomoserine (thiol)-lyase